MPRPRTEPLELEQRRQKIAAMYLRGQTQHEIGLAVGVDRSTISRDLAAIREQWKVSAVRDFDDAKAQELAKLDALERTYHEAWERSCKAKEKKSAKTVDGEHPRQEKAAHTEGRDGNPAFLQGVERCIELRAKLLGLIVKKHEHGGKDGGPIPITFIEVGSGNAPAADRGADAA